MSDNFPQITQINAETIKNLRQSAKSAEENPRSVRRLGDCSREILVHRRLPFAPVGAVIVAEKNLQQAAAQYVQAE